MYVLCCLIEGKSILLTVLNMLDLHINVRTFSLSQYSCLIWHSAPSPRPLSEDPRLFSLRFVSDVCRYVHLLCESLTRMLLECLKVLDLHSKYMPTVLIERRFGSILPSFPSSRPLREDPQQLRFIPCLDCMSVRSACMCL